MYKISVKNEVNQTYLVFGLAVFLFKHSDCGTVMATSNFSSHLKVICSEVYVLLKWSLFSETLSKNDGAQG